MAPKKDSQKLPPKKEKKTLLGWFFSREEPDKDYLPDLKSQWANMGTSERVKFIFGAIFGAVVFVTALLLAFWIMSTIIGLLGWR